MPAHTIQDYLEELNTIFTDVCILLSDKMYEESERKIKDGIKSIRESLREKPWGEHSDYYNNILIFGILLKSALDLVEIINLTIDNTWIGENKEVEKVWSKMLDCKERVLFVKNYMTEFAGKEFLTIECLENKYFEFILPNLERLEYVFEHNYGQSMYMSLEFTFKPVCSICYKDIRTCEHREKIIYNGALCKIIRHNPKMEMTNVVFKPEDYRCRIWHWNIDTSKNTDGIINTTFIAPIFTVFEVDNFLIEDDS